jgi:uncharacterized FAD-dependent dehydrogenase
MRKTDMNTLLLNGNVDNLIKSLFTTNGEGYLNFGLTGKSTKQSEISDLKNNFVEFRDYIMEGFVKYEIQAKPKEHGLELEVKLLGTNRDEYVMHQVRHYLKLAGVDVASD